jgi:ABC-type Fe3+-citrate transport system substrate-binding protein
MQLRKSTYSGKVMDPEVKTVPDQNMGIRELLDRHTKGIPLGVNSRQGEYFETEIPRFDDLTDMIEYKKELQGKMRKHNALIKQAKEEEEQKKLDALESNSTQEKEKTEDE